jgi:hypothetical protein
MTKSYNDLRTAVDVFSLFITTTNDNRRRHKLAGGARLAVKLSDILGPFK